MGHGLAEMARLPRGSIVQAMHINVDLGHLPALKGADHPQTIAINRDLI